MFSERLKSLRKRKKLTQEEAANKLGMARTTYSGYERGTSEPDFETLAKISAFYQEDLNWLITGVKQNVNEDLEQMIEDFVHLSDKDQSYILDLIDRLKKERH
ncbi:hypothetical protein BBD42_12945 [Paenibacillus sp. BIHB 4019]|uniref:HTH cro/C1-type domain-containing protein n=1 Tax=Paenibacillus sp. BIHB 4019 TaxID=1870819 RepID=A0A1B2DHR8_9BACL|nr:helix-turn-helix transcriptional regulator [Paenibacillus sp. BIHB 4019]ANY67277.1 hypothetical protein BBD42_12945 [Paenibacillus sp. BIHB 4019]